MRPNKFDIGDPIKCKIPLEGRLEGGQTIELEYKFPKETWYIVKNFEVLKGGFVFYDLTYTFRETSFFCQKCSN